MGRFYFFIANSVQIQTAAVLRDREKDHIMRDIRELRQCSGRLRIRKITAVFYRKYSVYTAVKKRRLRITDSGSIYLQKGGKGNDFIPVNKGVWRINGQYLHYAVGVIDPVMRNLGVDLNAVPGI